MKNKCFYVNSSNLFQLKIYDSCYSRNENLIEFDLVLKVFPKQKSLFILEMTHYPSPSFLDQFLF